MPRPPPRPGSPAGQPPARRGQPCRRQFPPVDPGNQGNRGVIGARGFREPVKDGGPAPARRHRHQHHPRGHPPLPQVFPPLDQLPGQLRMPARPAPHDRNSKPSQPAGPEQAPQGSSVPRTSGRYPSPSARDRRSYDAPTARVGVADGLGRWQTTTTCRPGRRHAVRHDHLDADTLACKCPVQLKSARSCTLSWDSQSRSGRLGGLVSRLRLQFPRSPARTVRCAGLYSTSAIPLCQTRMRHQGRMRSL